MWIKRIMLFVGGLFVMSLGVGLSIKSGLGVTPISSIPYSLTLASGANIGITTIIFNAILVFLQIPILKKRFKSKRLLQLINTGTILAAIFIGIIIRYLTELYEKITGKSITVVNKEN